MDAVHPALLDAVGALLLPEAGGVGGQGLGQGGLRDDLVDELADHGVLTGADEVQVLPLDLIHHGFHVGLAHDALHHVSVDHEGGDAEGEALVDHKVPGVGQHRLVEPGHIPHQVVEAIARHPAGSVHVHPVEALHDLGVVGDLKGGGGGFAEPLHLHIGGVVGADGDGGVDDVGDNQHDFPDFLRQPGLLLLQLGQPVGVGLHLGLGFLGFRQLGGVLLGLPHEHAHLLAEGVPGGPELVGFRHGGPVFTVQGQHLVHQGELFLLEFLLDVFLYSHGVLPDKTNVEHSFSFSFVVMFHVEHFSSFGSVLHGSPT